MSCVGREEVGTERVGKGVCELFVGGGSTSATSVLLRRRYPLTVRGYLFALGVAGPCPTSTLIRSYPGEPGRSLSATCDLFGSLQLGALRAIPLALWPNNKSKRQTAFYLYVIIYFQLLLIKIKNFFSDVLFLFQLF